jgi:hypothetical protein
MQKYNSKIWHNNHQFGSGDDDDDVEEDDEKIITPPKLKNNILKNLKSISNIDTDSSDAVDIDKELNMDDIKEFSSINEIPEFLEKVKNHYLNLSLNLDRHEISRLITKTLNVALLGYITTEQQIYDKIMNSYDEVKGKIKIIIEKIREFNRKNNNEYWVDLDKIVYILWFKEIKYVRNLLVDIKQNLDYQLNIVHINSYLIDKLYNEPKYTKYYIKILSMIIQQDSEKYLITDKLKNFFTVDKINKIYEIIRLIFSCDADFIKFLENNKKNKLDKEKENNEIEKNDNFNDIELFEKNFNKEKKELLLSIKKRKLNIDNLFKTERQRDVNYFNKFNYEVFKQNNSNEGENIPTINDIISNLDNDSWNAFNLFLYKKFDIDKNSYMQKINEISGQSLDPLVIDYFNDLEVPFKVDLGITTNESEHKHKYGTMLEGGNRNYLKKYLKYKQKYLELKK